MSERARQTYGLPNDMFNEAEILFNQLIKIDSLSISQLNESVLNSSPTPSWATDEIFRAFCLGFQLAKDGASKY